MINLVLGIVRIIPRRLGLKLFRGIGILLYYLMPGHRKVAAINLGIAFGDKMPDRYRREVVKMSFGHAMAFLFDFLKPAQMPTEALASCVEIEGEEHLRKAYELGRGVVAVSAH